MPDSRELVPPTRQDQDHEQEQECTAKGFPRISHGKPFVNRPRAKLRARTRRRGSRVRRFLGFLRLLRRRIHDGGVVLDLFLRCGRTCRRDDSFFLLARSEEGGAG